MGGPDDKSGKTLSRVGGKTRYEAGPRHWEKPFANTAILPLRVVFLGGLPMAGTDLSGLYVSQFATNIQVLLQQKPSRLRDKVMSGAYIGKQASPVDQVGAISMAPVLSRFAPIGRVDALNDRRWITPSDYSLNQLIDHFDKLRLLIDPQSIYVTNATYAANRQIDDIIIASFFAPAMTGVTGATLTTPLAGQIVPVNQGAASNTGLTVAKLRAGKKILLSNEVDTDSDPLTLVASADQLDNLMAEAQVISMDFNDRPVLVEGKVTRFLGIDLVHSERLPVDANGFRRCPLFAKSGMHVGIWNDIQTDVSQRRDLEGLPWQAYVMLSAGATRLEEKKIIEIKCNEP
jgi:capsid protein